MLFHQQKEYSSSLSIEEIVKRLHSISEKYHTNTSDRFKFEGKITSSSFELRPTFDYSPNYQLRPEILGEIIPHDTDTSMIVTFRLPQIFKNLMVFGLLIHMAIMALMICYPNLIDFPLWGNWWVVLAFLFLSYLSFLFFFNLKVSKSEEILKRILILHETESPE